MASPLNPGDCIAILKLLIAGLSALNSSSADHKLVTSLRNDLTSMKDCLQNLEASTRDMTGIPSQTLQSFQDCTASCRSAATDLNHFLETQVDAKTGAGRWWKRFVWSLSTKNDLVQYHIRVQGCLSSLNILQHEINRYLASLSQYLTPHYLTQSD
jgi:ABC-type antimicrobial peptide transport system ATPase subunit